MPLFATTEPPDRDVLVTAWSELFPGGGPLAIRGSLAEVAELRLGGGVVMVAHVPVPVPRDEATHAVRSSWMWQQPDAPVRSHRAHAIVSATAGRRGAVDEAWDVTRVCAALLRAGSGVALYWGSARQVHDPRLVVRLATKAETPPVPLWVGITLSSQSTSGPFSAATHGLEALGHRELEVLDSRAGVGALRMALCHVALDVVCTGADYRDGDSCGPSESVRWTVRHAPSALVPHREVILLGIP